MGRLGQEDSSLLKHFPQVLEITKTPTLCLNLGTMSCLKTREVQRLNLTRSEEIPYLIECLSVNLNIRGLATMQLPLNSGNMTGTSIMT